MYGSEGSCDFTEKTYNLKTHDLREPMGKWIGTTTFYLKPKIMRGSHFSISDLTSSTSHPRARVGDFVVQKRQYDRRYKNAEDCPLSDPDDSNDALENALYLESAVNGMKLGVRVKCGYKCRGREGFCTVRTPFLYRQLLQRQ